MTTLADELERLGKEATPGEWSCVDNSWEFSTIYDPNGSVLASVPIHSLTTEETQDQYEPIKEANAALIVALRNNLPTILSALREREEVEPVELRRGFLDAEPTDAMIDAGLEFNHRHNSAENMIASFKAMLAQAEIDGLIYASPVQREGMVWVPREPTEEMLRAGRIDLGCRRDCNLGVTRAGQVYAAMLSAAPVQGGEK